MGSRINGLEDRAPDVVAAWRGAEAGRLISVRREVRPLEGHETDACPLDHPLVGVLRCGEWLLFAGVHDLVHVQQLQRTEGSL